MPQLSPIHWLYSLIFLWVTMLNLITNMWWMNYVVYFSFPYHYVKRLMNKW
uniref:ATP synthase F0 subunit 8 n=1 Tax=Erpobdella octoculata TaxID=39305 RepID=X2C406_9ANNE|nr:ATP synthase F0 subunit 8 [Erpobdella octoculata]AGL34603.1 ATP synthase F0 subunit 8 [Erpobdella octoculata]